MKKIKIYLLNQKYEIELEDNFFEYLKDDIERLNRETTLKGLLNLMLSCKYESFQNEKKMTKLLQKIEKIL
jgi:small-conductance mechanosensitive channel